MIVAMAKQPLEQNMYISVTYILLEKTRLVIFSTDDIIGCHLQLPFKQFGSNWDHMGAPGSDYIWEYFISIKVKQIANL